MSKELEAFRDILGILCAVSGCEIDMDSERIKIVKQALHRLEAIDNANPSEALKCLDRIDNTLCLNNIKGKLEFDIDTEEHADCDSVIGMTEDLDTIKQALLKAQEEHRALEILHNKIDIELNYFDKSLYVGDYDSELSEEEFNLLKEVL